MRKRIAKKMLRKPCFYSRKQLKKAEKKCKTEITFQREIYEAGVSALCLKSPVIGALLQDSGFLGKEIWRYFVKI